MNPTSPGGWRFARWLLIAAGGFALLLVAATLIAGPLLSRKARNDLIRSLGQASHSDVTIGHVSVSFTPETRISARDLVFRYAGRTDVPPLIRARSLTMYAGLLGVLGQPRRFRKVVVDGVEVTIPPDRNRNNKRDEPSSKRKTDFDDVVITNSVLRILPAEGGGDALKFPVQRAEFAPLDRDRSMRYSIDMRNPIPQGQIRASGSVGPVRMQDPGHTPVSGSYEFIRADLNVFKDIGGTVSSKGKFSGVLERIQVTGSADSPDFKLRIGQHPVAVHFDFDATVDGTNGNIFLHPATARFMHSTIVANGEIVSKPRTEGKTVTLDGVVQPARIDDFLYLTNRPNDPFMTGPTTMRAHVVVPPEHRPFIDRVHVVGEFSIQAAFYNRPKVQQSVDKMSERARGDPLGLPDLVNSNVQAQCRVDGAIVHVSGMLFRAPGMAARVAGTYAIHSHALNFTGSMKTEAKASQMTTGWKSALLKVVDPFLKRKNAGAEIPIKVTGTREHPNFAVRKKL